MSVEDLDPDFQSDESDYEEAGKYWGAVEDEDEDEVHYMDLVSLHNELMHFEHIYMNHIEMDMQVDSFSYILTFFLNVL